MSDPTLVVRNGTVVTAQDTFRADIAVRGGQVVALGQALQGDETLDAEGLLVLPGGIDPHVHFAMPQGAFGVVSSDDWLTGTVAAAHGGTTTVVDFVEAKKGETWMQAYEARRAEASDAVIDYSFHMTANRADDASLAEIPAVVAAGMISFKMYMAYDGLRLTDDEMLRVLTALREVGALPIIHAENHAVIMHLVREQLAAGHTAPRWHPYTRPASGEAEATERCLTLAQIAGIPMHIVHVSAEAGLEAIERHRRRGEQVTGEVCPQYLVLTDEVYAQEGFAPAKYIMAPPIRAASDNAAMWRGLADGMLDFVVTDHCPFTLAQKRGDRRTPEFRRLPTGTIPGAPEPRWWNGAPNSAPGDAPSALPPFNRIPGGAAGVETRVPLVYHFGVNEGRLSLNRFVEVTSTAAARLYGLYPRKGTIAPGADADLVLFDPHREVTLTASALHQNVDYTPYEGLTVRGWPRTVLSRGEAIVRDEAFTGAFGRGQYLARKPKE